MTIISHRRKFIFVRPPKVAGASVTVALAPWCGGEDVIVSKRRAFRPGVDTDHFRAPPRRNDAGFESGHILPEVILDKVGAEVWNDYSKFTVARNPWDMFVSFFCFQLYFALLRRKRSRGTEKLRLLLVRMLEAGRRKESVEFAIRTGCFIKFFSRAPQFYFCGGREYADYVIRFENLQQDFDEVCRLLQLPGRVLPRINSELRPREYDYRDYYTDYSRAHVAKAFRRVIDTFGYRFGGQT